MSHPYYSKMEIATARKQVEACHDLLTRKTRALITQGYSKAEAFEQAIISNPHAYNNYVSSSQTLFRALGTERGEKLLPRWRF